MEVDYRDLGKRVRQKRKKQGMSQIELASRADLSTQHISNVENARSKIGLDKLVTIANVLNCSVDELLCGSMKVSRSVFNEDIAEVIDDFSDVEMRALPDLLRAFNYSYRLMKEEVKDQSEE